MDDLDGLLMDGLLIDGLLRRRWWQSPPPTGSAPRGAGRRINAIAGALVLASLAAVAACGDLPRPFQGAPGRQALLLRRPPPARLAVPTPGEALLSDEGASAFAEDIAAALVARDLPVRAAAASKGDWRLAITASAGPDGTVVPHFAVLNPKGEQAGQADGDPVPAAQWSLAAPETLRTAASIAAPRLTETLAAIEARLRESDPNSLYNRPARVYVAEVDGAPGDGDTALTRQMRAALTPIGIDVQDRPRNADFILEGHVAISAGAGGTEQVEIQWVLKDAADERARIVQLNDVPPHTLDRFWGDVATVVAQQAAGGVKDAILTQAGRRGRGGAGTATPTPPLAAARS